MEAEMAPVPHGGGEAAKGFTCCDATTGMRRELAGWSCQEPRSNWTRRCPDRLRATAGESEPYMPKADTRRKCLYGRFGPLADVIPLKASAHLLPACVMASDFLTQRDRVLAACLGAQQAPGLHIAEQPSRCNGPSAGASHHASHGMVQPSNSELKSIRRLSRWSQRHPTGGCSRYRGCGFRPRVATIGTLVEQKHVRARTIFVTRGAAPSAE